MKIIRNAVDFLCNTIGRLINAVELSRYNRFTIAEYFRKQGAQIGEGCSIIPKVLGGEPYLVKLGNDVTIAHGVLFGTHDGAAWIFRKEIPNIQVCGPIIIGNNCIIGEGSMIACNVRIGDNCIVGAGSVVISDVPSNTMVMGIPARPFGSIEKYKEKCAARWKEQCPPDIIIEEGATWWSSRHLKENREKLKKHLIKLFWESDQKQTLEKTNVDE